MELDKEMVGKMKKVYIYRLAYEINKKFDQEQGKEDFYFCYSTFYCAAVKIVEEDVAWAVERIKLLPETDGYDKKQMDDYILTFLCTDDSDALVGLSTDVTELLNDMYPQKFHVNPLNKY